MREVTEIVIQTIKLKMHKMLLIAFLIMQLLFDYQGTKRGILFWGLKSRILIKLQMEITNCINKMSKDYKLCNLLRKMIMNKLAQY